MKVLERVLIKDFKHRRGIQDCKTLALRDVLEFYGLNLSPESCFGLGGGLDFNCIEYNGGKKNVPLVSIWGRNMDLEKNVCQSFNIKQNLYLESDPKKAWSIVKNFVDNGVPTIIDLDGTYLHGSIPEKSNTSYWGITSSAVVIGYEKINAEVHVLLTNGLLRSLYTLRLEDLINARQSQCLPFPPQNKCYSFVFPDKLTSKKEVLEKSFKQVLLNMLHSPDQTRGVQGISNFSSKLKMLLNQIEHLQKEIADKYLYIQAQSIIGGFQAGSSTFFRKEYAAFLLEFGKRYRNKTMQNCGKNYALIAKEWSEIRKNLVNAQKEKKGISLIFQEITKKLDNLAIFEHEALNNLKALVNS